MRRKRKTAGIRPAITVKNGVDVYCQALGSKKGEYFSRGDDQNGTIPIQNGKQRKKTFRFCLTDADTGAQYIQEIRDCLYIGRVADDIPYAKLVLPDDGKISKNHCLVFMQDGALYLKDLQSRNHTFLNGTMIADPVRLANGDLIRIGCTTLRIYF